MLCHVNVICGADYIYNLDASATLMMRNKTSCLHGPIVGDDFTG